MKAKGGERFFTQDRGFYRTLFSIFTMVMLQNVVAYSVNMLDNIMLGSYAQAALSGAATVNQIFFMVQQVTLTVCDALVILASQYYGQKRMSPVQKVAGHALKLAFVWGIFFAGLCLILPGQLLGIFTRDPEIARQGMDYLALMRFSYVIFGFTTVLSQTRSMKSKRISAMAALRSMPPSRSICSTT